MPFLIPLIALITGIVAGAEHIGPIWGIAPILAGLAYYLFLLKKSSVAINAIKLNSRHSVWIFLLFAGIGIFVAWFHRPMTLTDHELETYAAVEGEIEDSKTLANGDRFTVDVYRLADKNGNIKECHNLTVLLSTDGLSASKGDIIRFPTRLERITDNPNYRSSGYKERMNRIGVFYRCHSEYSKIRINGHNSGVRSSASLWRDNIVSKLENSALQRPTIDFLTAMMFGDRTFLSDEIKDSFSNAGVAHVLALSGMHVAIVMGLILFLLFPLKLIGIHWIRYWLALTILWAYAFFSGLAPSTVRASIMTTFVILALSLQRRNASGNALLASAFVILLFNPFALFDIGMQLSFLCVASILAFAGPLNTVNRHFHPKMHSLVASILVSLIATLSSWVLISYYFKKIPLLFLPANLIILPVLPIYMGIAFLYLGLLLFGYDASILAFILNKGYSLFITVTDTIASFGESAINFQVQLPIVVIWLLGVLVLGTSIRKKKKWLSLSVGAGMLAGSILLIPILRKEEPDGLIFQKNHSEISLALYNHGEEGTARLPRNSVSKIIHKGCEIISLDCRANLDSLANIIKASRSNKKRYMIIGSGFSGKTLHDIPCLESFEKIIIHSSIRKKKESQILKEAKELGINTIHSIREEGPLEIFL